MKQKQIKHIVFDWSGVIADTFDNWFIASTKIFEHFGHKKLSIKESRENFTQPYMVFYNKYMPKLGLKEQQKVYEKIITKLPPANIFPGMRSEILKFKKAGVELSILSGDRHQTLFLEMKKYKLKNIFNQIEYNIHDKTKTIKKVISKSDYNPKETVFIGDTTHEIEAGKKVGCQTCSVTWGFMTKRRLSKTKPTYIVSKPSLLFKTLIH
ncbi:MAG: HAD family hydrolase [Candidatus Kerfeldbacteria bacterium]|jgi:HAD superfamily hydrolase (TIGR01509 family)